MKLNKKIIQRITSVCAAVVIVAACFLLPVSAAEAFTDFNLTINYQIFDTSRDIITATNTLDKDNGSKFLMEAVSDDTVVNYAMYAQMSINFKKIDGGFIASAGDSLNISIVNIATFLELDGNSYIWDDYSKTARFLEVYYIDGSTERFDRNINWYYNSSQYNHSISGSINVSKDVIAIKYLEYININAWTGFFGYANQILIGGDLSNPLTVSVQNVTIQNQIGDIDNKLDSAINGTPEQNQQAQDAVGGLNSSTDKLGQLGDTMASVEKPTIDSNKISAGSLVPSTSLVVLSSPFQALWENKQLLAMLTIVVTLVLVSWVFFGKKG